MPIYEYRCENCDRKFTKILKMSEKDNFVDCEACGGVIKLIPSKGGRFKIEGFSESNGYSSTPDISYDGVDREW